MNDRDAKLVREWLRGGREEIPIMSRPDLSEKQLQAIVTAYEMDYFVVPRAVNLHDIGDAMGISHQAASERMRRGHAALVEALLDGPEDAIEAGPLGIEFDGDHLRVFNQRVVVGRMTPEELLAEVME